MPLESIDYEALVKGLSAVASTLSIAASYQKLTSSSEMTDAEAIEELKKHATPAELIALSDPALIASAIEIRIISGPLLNQLRRDAQACEKRYIAALKKAGPSFEEREAARETAKECMCRTLREIKAHNGGKLPGADTDPLPSYWIAYRCSP